MANGLLNTKQMSSGLLDTKEAGDYLGINDKSLANSRYTGTGIQIPYIKMGRLCVIVNLTWMIISKTTLLITQVRPRRNQYDKRIARYRGASS